MLKLVYQKLIHPIVSSHDSPAAVAGGMAVGLGLALTPTIGIQMPLAWVVATLFGASRVVAVAAVWVSNPLTMPIIYYGEYMLGCWLLDYESITSYNQFMAEWHAGAELGVLERIRALSAAIAIPLLVGSAVPAVGAAGLAYPTTLVGVRRLRARRGLRKRQSREAVSPTRLPADSSYKEKAIPPSRSSPLSRPGLKGPVLLLFPALLGCMGATSCRDGERGPYEVAELPEQSWAEGAASVHAASLEDGTLLIVGPYHAALQRQRFTAGLLDARFGLEQGAHHYLSLRVYRFAEQPKPLDLGADGISLEVHWKSGSATSVPPSKLVSELGGKPEEPLLRSLLGGGDIPDPGHGQLALLVVLPAVAPLDQVERVTVHLPAAAVDLQRGDFDAAALERFHEEPAADAFEQGFRPRAGLQAAGGAADSLEVPQDATRR